jgi:cold shock CspA family protein/ribosome-associated translation inhibitor RaiA
MLPIQISLRNLTLSPDMEADIRERAAGLRLYDDRLMGCRVTVEVPNRRHHAGSRHSVRIDLTVPGGELVVRRRPHEDVRTAVQIAFNAARRRLQDYARRRRGAVKVHEPQPIARVAQYHPLGGYGFLETADGRRIYFDAHSVVDGGFGRLAVGMEVRFTEEEGDKGPQASTVVPHRRRHHRGTIAKMEAM